MTAKPKMPVYRLKFRRTSAKTVAEDLRAFARWIELESNASDRRLASGLLNDLLDEAMANDMFGTEGQCDPRGDHRS